MEQQTNAHSWYVTKRRMNISIETMVNEEFESERNQNRNQKENAKETKKTIADILFNNGWKWIANKDMICMYVSR